MIRYGIWLSPSGLHIRHVVKWTGGPVYFNENDVAFGFSKDDTMELFEGWTFLGKL